MNIQKRINQLDAIIASKPRVLAQYKEAKSSGAPVQEFVEELKRIQAAVALKPVLLSKMENAVAKIGRGMEFGGFSITSI
jgi:hypothetical protein